MKVVPPDLTSHERNDGRVKPRREPDRPLFYLISVHEVEGRAMTRSPSAGSGELRLKPRLPPGRTTRKARAYAVEIRRLHELGYTLDAIREALADVGVNVSRSTVWRETMHPTNDPSAAPVVGAPRG